MLVEAETGKFLTQREHPQMARLCPEVTDDSLDIAGPHGNLSLLWRKDSLLTRREVTVWGFTGEALDEGEIAAEYFSHFMGFPCRLVRTPEDFTRRINPKYGSQEDRVGFADGYAVLLASESSLAVLNARLENPVPMNRFRPNIVISGAEPFVEDSWKTLCAKSGVTFRVAKPCARCAMTTVNQVTGEKTGAEPLATLARFRRNPEGKVDFAVNLIHDAPGGVLRVGDMLSVV